LDRLKRLEGTCCPARQRAAKQVIVDFERPQRGTPYFTSTVTFWISSRMQPRLPKPLADGGVGTEVLLPVRDAAILRQVAELLLIGVKGASITNGGTVRPSAFAVLRLITSSNFVGCSTGRTTVRRSPRTPGRCIWQASDCGWRTR